MCGCQRQRVATPNIAGAVTKAEKWTLVKDLTFGENYDYLQACKLTGVARNASNRRRVRIGELYQNFVTALETNQFREGERNVKERLRLLAEEDVALPTLMQHTEYEGYQACKKENRHTEARVWLEKAQMHNLMAEGKDSPSAHKYAKLLALPIDTHLEASRLSVV